MRILATTKKLFFALNVGHICTSDSDTISCIPQVVVLDLEVLAEISSSKTCRPIEGSNNVPMPTSAMGTSNMPPSNTSTSPHFKQFMLSLLKLFSADRSLLEAKGSFIIRQLCVLLSSEDIYRSISELLVLEDNLKFARLMVETLSTILLTSSELFELRTKLKVTFVIFSKLPANIEVHIFRGETFCFRTWGAKKVVVFFVASIRPGVTVRSSKYNFVVQTNL